MNIANRLTDTDFAELCGVLCPYCKAKLPAQDNMSPKDPREVRAFLHTIPGTGHTFLCEATKLRDARRDSVYRMPAE